MVDNNIWLTLFLEFKTMYMFMHMQPLAQKYSVGLQEIFVSRLCSQEENSFFLPWMIALSVINCSSQRSSKDHLSSVTTGGNLN